MTGDHATRPLSHAHLGPSSRLPEWGADAGEAERAHGASRTRGGEARRGSRWQGRVLRQGVGRAGAPHSEPGRRGAGPGTSRGALACDQRRRAGGSSAGVGISTARAAAAVGERLLVPGPPYAKPGISHSRADCDRPEVREINARLGHFIIVILFFQTLPLTFNFAPELIVCSLQYDRWTRVRGPRHLALALTAEARGGEPRAVGAGRPHGPRSGPAIGTRDRRPPSVQSRRRLQAPAPGPGCPSLRSPGPGPPGGSHTGRLRKRGRHTWCPSLLGHSDHEPPSAPFSASAAHQLRSYRLNYKVLIPNPETNQQNRGVRCSRHPEPRTR